MFKVLSVTIGVLLLCAACDNPTNPVTVNNIIRTDTLTITDTIKRTDTLIITDTIKHTDTLTNQNFIPVIVKDTITRIDTIKHTDTLTQQKLIYVVVRDTITKHDTVYVPSVSSGYQYYRFVVDSAGLAGSSCIILTETDFIKNGQHYPTPRTVSVISHSPIAIGSIEALFDTDTTTGSTTGNYAKFTSTPWEWVIDMKQTIKFDSFYLSSWETFFYQEPSKVSIYGSMNLTGNWTLIGHQVFTQVYQSTTVPLTY